MNVKKIYEYWIVVMIGSLITFLALELRFRNPLLLEELIFFMKSGKGYFITFAILDAIAIFILTILYITWFRKKKRLRSKLKKKKKDKKK